MKNQFPISTIIRNISSNGLEYAAEIREWVNESIENKEIYDDILHLSQASGSLPECYSPDRSKAWEKVSENIHNRKKKYIHLRVWQVAAAVLIIFFLAGLSTTFYPWPNTAQYTEVISPSGQKTQVRLPDSSYVLLNGNSTLRFCQNFNGDCRRVELKGEGYFDVKKDLSREFIVSTTDIDVKVYGTSFNVKAYPNDQIVEVGLKNGLVGLEYKGKEIMQLKPGHMATFQKKEKKIDVTATDIDLVAAWTRDEMVFEEESIQEIAKYLERWYGVNIQVSPRLLDGELLTFKVKTESLNELLTLINLIKPIKYHIDGKQVTITKP